MIAAATAQAARSAACAGGAALSPRAVTRGEDAAGAQAQAAAVDWLNATFISPGMTPEGFVSLLSRMFGRPLSGVEGGGFLGFRKSIKLMAHHGGDASQMGFLAFGGESQGGRWLLSLSGKGCQFVPDWQALADLLEDLDAKVTRLDLAVDFLEGQYSVDDAVEMYRDGGFQFEGRMAPKTSCAGDWIDQKDGRTFYVGKSQNGKMLRVYEKGLQLGDAESAWVRFEVQLGNRDRVIPLRALVERDAFFAGAYPALQELVEHAAEHIRTSRKKGETTLAHLVHHMRRSYGKLVDVLAKHIGTSSTDLVEEVRVIGLPRRLDFTSAVAGVEWAGVVATLERIRACNA